MKNKSINIIFTLSFKHIKKIIMIESDIKINRPEVIFFDVNETLLDLEPLKKNQSIKF